MRSGHIHAVQFRRDSKRNASVVAASEPVVSRAGGEDAFVSALRRLTENGDFEGNRVVSALPANEVEIRPLRLPKGVSPGSANFGQALLNEARSCLLYDPAEAVLDYLPFAGEGLDADQRQMVLLIASRRERVNRFLAIFKEAGLHCEHLEVAGCAAARVLKGQQGCYAIVDLDQLQTVISVAEGSRMLFSRIVKLGYGEWIQRVANALEVSPLAAQELLQDIGVAQTAFKSIDLDLVEDSGLLASEIVPAVLHEVCGRSIEQLAREIRRTTDYFALLPGGGRVEHVYLLGDLFPNNIAHSLQERLQVPVSIGAPQLEAGAPPADERFAARLTIAQGLALRGRP